jgi:predicted flap endonuclease-1-like 5' DNA nuclease
VDFAKDDRGNLLNEVARLKADKMALNQEMVMLHDELEDRTKVRDEAIQAYEELRAYLEQNGSAAKSAVQTTKPQRTVSQDRVSAPVRIAETIIVAKEEPPELPRLESPAESIAPAPVVMERSSVPKPVEENAEAPPSPPAPASPAVVLPTIQLQATSSSAPRRTVPTQPVSYQSFDGEKSPLKKKPGEGGTAEPDLFSVSSADPDALDGEQDGLSGKRPPGLSVPRGGKEDNLALIKGVGPQSVERLNQIGIWHFAQVAAWSAEETEWVGNYLSFPGRIERDQWVSQASQLAQGIIAAPAEPKRRAGSRRRR